MSKEDSKENNNQIMSVINRFVASQGASRSQSLMRELPKISEQDIARLLPELPRKERDEIITWLKQFKASTATTLTNQAPTVTGADNQSTDAAVNPTNKPTPTPL